MRKKLKKYASMGITSVLLLTAMPLQTILGADVSNNENIMDTGDRLSDDREILKEPAIYLSEAGNSVIEDGVETANRAADETSEDITAFFEDDNFTFAIREILGLNDDAPLTKTACANVEELDISGKGIRWLSGIEYFSGLKTLNCSNNQLTGLGSLEACTKLTELNCSNNQLTGLYLYDNIGLTNLDCSNNCLGMLHVSDCTNLTVLNCSNNYLTELNVSGCISLLDLNCSQNYIDSPDNITGYNDGLIGENFILGIQNKNSDVTEDFVDINFRSAVKTELGLGEDEPITEIDCAKMTKSLDVSGHEIKSLSGIEYFTNITYLYCQNNKLTELDVNSCTNLDYLDCAGNQLTTLNVNNCVNLTRLQCGRNEGEDGYYSKEGGNHLTALNISNCKKLTWLSCYGNELTELDLENLTELDNLDCEDNKLSVLDVNNCSNLRELSCFGNQLTVLYVDKCTNLENLSCYDNKLEALNVEGCIDLGFLFCYGNQLKILDVSNCAKLTWLACESNQLESLDISGCTKLKQLYCGIFPLSTDRDSGALSNQLRELDLSNCPELTKLYCDHNQLSVLDISQCSKLTDVNCSYNNMKNQGDIIGDISNITTFTFDPQNNSTPEPSNIPTQAPKKAQKMTAKPGSLELYVGGITKNLKVSNAIGAVTYKSSAPRIVKVSNKGKVTPLSKGKAIITIRAAGDSTYGAASKKINVTVYGKPAKVKSIKVVPAKAKRTLKVSWKKVPSVSGYIIKYSYNKNMKNSETIRVNKSSTSKNIKKLTSKKYVYIQVQAYKKDGSALIKGAWSKKTRSSGKVR